MRKSQAGGGVPEGRGHDPQIARRCQWAAQNAPGLGARERHDRDGGPSLLFSVGREPTLALSVTGHYPAQFV